MSASSLPLTLLSAGAAIKRRKFYEDKMRRNYEDKTTEREA